MDPTPENLARLHRERVERARRMSPERKLMAGPELFELGVECMRSGIRLTHPGLGEAEITGLVRERLRRQREKDERAFHAGG
jgi:hypothetical protein